MFSATVQDIYAFMYTTNPIIMIYIMHKHWIIWKICISLCESYILIIPKSQCIKCSITDKCRKCSYAKDALKILMTSSSARHSRNVRRAATWRSAYCLPHGSSCPTLFSPIVDGPEVACLRSNNRRNYLVWRPDRLVPGSRTTGNVERCQGYCETLSWQSSPGTYLTI